MSMHPLAIAGWVLLVVGLLLYLGSIVAAVLRVGKQYSRAIQGHTGLHVSAAVAAAGRRWFFLALAVLGVVIVVLAR